MHKIEIMIQRIAELGQKKMALPWWQGGRILELHVDYSTLASTHQEALSLAASVFSKGFPVDVWLWLSARTQWKGHGQYQRPFFSPPGGLYATLLCRWPDSFLSPLTACALSYNMASRLQQAAYLKWPNDVYINDEKIAGSLCQSVTITDTSGQAYVLGCLSFGINIRTPSRVLSCGRKISSIKNALDPWIDRVTFFNTQKYNLPSLLYQICHPNPDIILKMCQRMNPYFRGYHQRVEIITKNGLHHSGIFLGVDPWGRVKIDHKVFSHVERIILL